MTKAKIFIYNCMRMKGKIYLGLNILSGPSLEPVNVLEAYVNFVKQTLLCLSTAVRYIMEYMCSSESY